MKLPKGLGNMGNLMKQAQEAMAKAQNLEKELAMEEIIVDRGGVTAKFNGVGELLSVKISPELVNPEDIESLEDAVLLALREGNVKTTELRQQKVGDITGGFPIPPGMNPF